jgi:uncharacterized delta-60 repeat protein
MSQRKSSAGLRSFFLVACTLFTATVVALPTDFDNSFGTNGEARWNTANGASTRYDSAEAIIRDARGRYYVASLCQQNSISTISTCLTRLTASGALDPSFGNQGAVVTANVGTFSYINGGPRLAFQSDGKLILASQCASGQTFAFCIDRYSENGALDASFGVSGRAGVDASGVNRFNEPTALVIDALDRIVVGGNCTNVANNRSACAIRLTTNGALDTSYGNGGRAVIGFDGQGGDQWINAMALAGGSSVVFAATCSTSSDQAMCVGKLGSNGQLVSNFGGVGAGGRVLLSFSAPPAADAAATIAVQLDQKIVVGGTCYAGFSSFCLARLNADGSADGTFDGGFASSGLVRAAFEGHTVELAHLTILPDGRILAVGTCTFNSQSKICAARFHGSGQLDRTFTATGKHVRDIPTQRAAASVIVEPDGGVLIAGRCRNATDSEFDSCVLHLQGGPVTYSICSLDIDGDGALNSTDALIWSRLMFGSDSRFTQGLSFAPHATRSAAATITQFGALTCRLPIRRD